MAPLKPSISTIRSMTGYGRAEGQHKGISLTVELRSVNHRYCDVAVKLPKILSPFEDAVKKQLKQHIERGHIDLTVTWIRPTGNGYALDLEAAKSHYEMLKKLKKGLGLKGEVTFDQVTRFRDFIVPVESAVPPAASSLLKKVVGHAIAALDAMRLREGSALASDISGRIQRLIKTVEQIETQHQKKQPERYQRLCRRVYEFTQKPAVDRERLEQELALMINREDISEEMTRLRVHLAEFNRLLCEGTSVGRRLDFLTQEIGREINTLGSKANDETIALDVVAMKCELEKIREQVQNLE